MAAIRTRTQRTLFFSIACLLGLSLFAPIVALGNGDLGSGDTATIATGGGEATLRAEASFAGASIGSIPNGTDVFIIDGPITDTDGSIWYMAGVWEITGFISATILDGVEDETTTDPAPAAESATTVIPWQQPIDYGVVVDNSAAPLPTDGLACRVDVMSSADVIVRLALGQSVEVVDEEIWSEGVAFLPVNCAGQGGFVKADYVALNSETAPEPVADEAMDPVVDDTAEEVVADEVAADQVVEESATDAPLVGDLIVTISDQAGNPVPGACFDLYAAEGWVAHACDSNDAIPNNGNSGFFGIPEGSYTVIAASAPDGLAIPNLEAMVVAGDTSYTGATVTTTVVDEPVVSEEVIDDVVTEEVADAAATEEVVDDVATAVVTDVVVTEEVVEDVATEEVVDELATEEVVDEVATEEVVDEVATEEVSEEVAAEAVTDELTTSPDLTQAIGDATVTGTNGDGVRCRVAPDPDAATITVIPEGATVFVLEAPTNGFLGVACANQLGYVDVNFMWTGEGEGDEIPASAASVVVVGSGGMMLNCRDGAGAGFEAIAAVPSGSILTTRGESIDSWAPVVCGGLNGFVSTSFLDLSDNSSATDTASPTPPEPAGTGTVTNTDGEGLRCRIASDGAVIAVLPEGMLVTTRGPASGGWVPVICAGSNGFVAAANFTLTDSGAELPELEDDDGSGRGGGGSGNVTGTGGASLNCRSAGSMSGMVIMAFTAGAQVALRGAASNGWQPVICANRNGYVSSSFITASTNSSSPAPGSASGSGSVTNTGGIGLRCRTSAPGGATISVLPEGMQVATRGSASGGWVPVVCASMNGFVSAEFFTIGSTTPNPGAGNDGGGGAASGFVRVSGTGSASLNCRSAASMSGLVITAIPAGSSVSVRAAAAGGWQQVTCAGRSGYVSTMFVTATTDPGSGNDPGVGQSGSARVANTSGDGLRCRTTAPSGLIITVIAEGASVTTRDASSNGWTPVVCGGREGFMSSQFLTAGSGTGAPDPNPTPAPGGSGMSNGDRGKVSVRANMRYQASMGAQVMIVVERGEVLQITGNATNGFYPVNYDGLRAFMSAELLTETSEPLSKRSGGGSGVSVGVDAVLGSLTPRISQPFGQTAFSLGAGSWMYGYAAGLGVPLAHPGIDYSMPYGTRLYVPVSGTVIYAGGTGWFRDSRGDGAGRGELRIRTDNGHEIIFGHMSWIPLLAGQRVVAGELAGLSGSFNGDHLHLEVRVPGNTSSGWQAIDPSRYFGGVMTAYRNQVTGV